MRGIFVCKLLFDVMIDNAHSIALDVIKDIVFFIQWCTLPFLNGLGAD
ncbi:hypothetical protein [Halodesulfovibrio spirochaetisodalis]|nr:hypothetical protein [Halodesulfovibrio spirochaetisodalis]